MNDLGVIDRFMNTFIHYIDSGFGILDGDVAHLTAFLIGLDITLAGLAWALDSNGTIMPKLIKKILYVGTFAFILNNFSFLADAIFNSFAGLGLNVTNNTLTAGDLLRPGRLADIGFDSAWPLIDEATDMVSYTNFFSTIWAAGVLVFAWLIVVGAFFILAVQLFITVIEFKLTTLAGFVLVPFALWNKSSFLAERVLGNVISSGIKVMVLAVIVGIGSTFFSDFTTALNGQSPTLGQAASIVLAAITLFGLGIFGPGIAAGLVSGAPQLGAGAAVGTAGGIAAGGMLVGGTAMAGGKMLASAATGAVRAGTALASGSHAAYRLGQASSGTTGMAGVASGMAGVAKAGAGALGQKARNTAKSLTDGFAQNSRTGTRAAWAATGGTPPKGAANAGKPSNQNNQPDWARNFRSEQRTRAHAHAAAQAVKEGDKGGAAANPSLSEQE
ncbi:MAG: P-type conjugative transfer protein TrbL [Rhodospirillaceae bacterium]